MICVISCCVISCCVIYMSTTNNPIIYSALFHQEMTSCYDRDEVNHHQLDLYSETAYSENASQGVNNEPSGA